MIEGNKGDTEYCDGLAGRSREYCLLHDIAKAREQIRIARNELEWPNVRPFRFGEVSLGRGRFGRPHIVLDLGSGEFECVEGVVAALAFFEAEMERIGI